MFRAAHRTIGARSSSGAAAGAVNAIGEAAVSSRVVEEHRGVVVPPRMPPIPRWAEDGPGPSEGSRIRPTFRDRATLAGRPQDPPPGLGIQPLPARSCRSRVEMRALGFLAAHGAHHASRPRSNKQDSERQPRSTATVILIPVLSACCLSELAVRAGANSGFGCARRRGELRC